MLNHPALIMKHHLWESILVLAGEQQHAAYLIQIRTCGLTWLILMGKFIPQVLRHWKIEFSEKIGHLPSKYVPDHRIDAP